MFANIGWAEMVVLVVIGLVVLGPERLPGAIRWTAGALRQARDYVGGATSQLRQDLGPEFDDLRQPLSELQKLRGMTPRAALTKHLLDGDDSWIKDAFDTGTTKPQSAPSPSAADSGPAAPVSTTKPAVEGPSAEPAPAKPTATPYDSDAT